MKWNRPPFITLTTMALFFALVVLKPVYGGDNATKEAPSPAGKAPMTHLYGNHECPVSGEAVVPDASVTYNDKEHGVYGRIYLCCIGCEKKVKKNISEVYKTLYRTDKKTGKPMEPKDLKNEKCPMSGEPVDAKAFVEYNGMIVHFCCPGCAQGFLKNPEAKMAVLLPDAKEFEFKAKPGSHSSM